jgi:hypothetical protein
VTRSRRPALAMLALMLAACGGTGGAPAPTAPPAAADPHPCDLLTGEQVASLLGTPAVEVERSEAETANGGQASCSWTADDGGAALGLIVEGPGFFSTGPSGYTDSAVAYQFWRDDALEAGFPVIDIEAAGDAAFVPVLGDGAPNTLVMHHGDYLVHVSLVPGGEAPMSEAARMVAAALGDRTGTAGS